MTFETRPGRRKRTLNPPSPTQSASPSLLGGSLQIVIDHTFRAKPQSAAAEGEAVAVPACRQPLLLTQTGCRVDLVCGDAPPARCRDCGHKSYVQFREGLENLLPGFHRESPLPYGNEKGLSVTRG